MYGNQRSLNPFFFFSTIFTSFSSFFTSFFSSVKKREGKIPELGGQGGLLCQTLRTTPILPPVYAPSAIIYSVYTRTTAKLFLPVSLSVYLSKNLKRWLLSVALKPKDTALIMFLLNPNLLAFIQNLEKYFPSKDVFPYVKIYLFFSSNISNGPGSHRL